jgi:hypothetical protein
MADGSTASLGRLGAGHLEDIEFDVAAWAVRYKADTGEALLGLRRALSEEAKREWSSRGLPDVHGAAVLLAFLRQLEEQGWAFSEGVSCESEEATKARLRMLWIDDEASRASCERGLDGQPSGECSDPLRVLSSILARHAQEAWGVVYEAYASIGLPLAIGARARVGRLRAYGNALNAQAASHFISCFLEAEASGFTDLVGPGGLDDEDLIG